jgi:hypothetical protein
MIISSHYNCKFLTVFDGTPIILILLVCVMNRHGRFILLFSHVKVQRNKKIEKHIRQNT